MTACWMERRFCPTSRSSWWRYSKIQAISGSWALTSCASKINNTSSIPSPSSIFTSSSPPEWPWRCLGVWTRRWPRDNGSSHRRNTRLWRNLRERRSAMSKIWGRWRSFWTSLRRSLFTSAARPTCNRLTTLQPSCQESTPKAWENWWLRTRWTSTTAENNELSLISFDLDMIYIIYG